MCASGRQGGDRGGGLLCVFCVCFFFGGGIFCILFPPPLKMYFSHDGEGCVDALFFPMKPSVFQEACAHVEGRGIGGVVKVFDMFCPSSIRPLRILMLLALPIFKFTTYCLCVLFFIFALC